MAVVVSLMAFLLSLHSGLGAHSEASLETSLQGILDRATLISKGTALSLGVALPSRSISLSSGKQQMGKSASNSADVAPSDAFAMGSTMKMYTAAAILRLVDDGKIGLDDRALSLFDTLWTKLNGTSIVHALGSQIKDVTVRHLLQMRSGIPDFDSLASRGYQFDHPSEDLGPVKELSFLEPGKKI
jgi:CubicO group peptidase (beta-lactamase class C family)